MSTLNELACKKCGVLLWNAEKHYADAHSFPCVVDDCPQRFYRYSDLNAHSREHTTRSRGDTPEPTPRATSPGKSLPDVREADRHGC
jgi:hypothetical protein